MPFFVFYDTEMFKDHLFYKMALILDVSGFLFMIKCGIYGVLCSCLFDRISLCVCIQAGLQLFVAQSSLGLVMIILPEPPTCWDYRHESLCWLGYVFFFFF